MNKRGPKTDNPKVLHITLRLSATEERAISQVQRRLGVQRSEAIRRMLVLSGQMIDDTPQRAA